MRYTLVGLGEILWDMLPSGKQMGGAPANFAYHAQSLSADTVTAYPVSAIGNDSLGKEISTHLKTQGLSDKYLFVDEQYPTGTVQVEYQAGGGHRFHIKENVAWDYIPDITSLEQLATKTDVVCFGTLAQRAETSRHSIHTFLHNVPKHCLRIFDINLRQSYYSKLLIENSLHIANILKMNDEDDFSILAGYLSFSGHKRQLPALLAEQYDLKVVILTQGQNGSLLYSQQADRIFQHNSPHLTEKVVNTIGAGDSFTAAIAIGLLKNYDFEYLNDCANRVAAFVCTQSGAMPVLPENITNLFNL